MRFIKLRSQVNKKYMDESLKASRYIPTISYDPDNEFFLLDENYVGLCFMCQPLNGFDNLVNERLMTFLNQGFPENTGIQFVLFKSPDINRQMYEMMALRDGFNDDFLKSNIVQRQEFLTHHTHTPLVTNSPNAGTHNLGLIYDLKLFISVKLKIEDVIPSEAEMGMIKDWNIKITSALKSIGLYPRVADAETYIRFMNTLLNWNLNTSWRHDATKWDENEPINTQLLDYENAIDISEKNLKIGDYHVACLSAKHFPDSLFIGNALRYIGDLSGQGSNIRDSYMIVTNIIVPHQLKTKGELDNKRKYIITQSDGPFQRYIPIIKDKRQDFDLMYDSLKDGDKILKIAFSVVLFSKTEESLNTSLIAAQAHFREQQFELLEDRYMHLPMFLNSLPLCQDVQGQKDLFRYKTLTSQHIAPLLPVFGEWKGTGTPHLTLISRNGQLMTLSLHNAGPNSNALIAAQSGSGKSFLVNDFILSYLSEGAQVWVIDVGRSYLKLCKTLKGDFIHFANDADIGLNPFELIGDDYENYEEQEDTLVALIRAMASPKGKLDEYQDAELKTIINRLFHEKGKHMNVNDIAQACKDHNDPRVKDIGSQLNAFTSNGSYGKYFSRSNNINFENQFTVLELDDLQGRNHLRQVVLLQLIFQIQQAVYFGDRSVKKVVIIDEGWDLLNDGETAKFLEHAYRKFRKYGGSCVLATQSINDLYSNEQGRAIIENSASMYLLGQKEESIESVRESKRLAMSDGAFNALKTVHTIQGVYSEIFIRTTEAGMGIGRLVVSDYQKLLYSTNANDVAQIESYEKQGLSTMDAILQVMKQRSR